MNAWFSASDLEVLAKSADLKTLPKTERGISTKAKREEWAFEKVDGKGGPGGKKTIFQLPTYVVEELEKKGLLHLIDGAESGVREETQLEQTALPPDVFPYMEWASRQDTSKIVPVRYYKEVFASAGAGAIPWDTEPEAMWFRTSFFQHLRLTPADCFCTRIDGDSMFPTLIDQGTVMWQSVAQYTREGIYLFRQHDELRVKRLQRLTADTLNIISDNPNKSIYPTIQLTLTAENPDEFQILGKYLWDCGIAP